jgi:hypothetical protein
MSVHWIASLTLVICVWCFVVSTPSAYADQASTSLTVRLAQCADGTDNDGDLLVDYPADPDCLSLVDDDEAGLSSPTPQCADGTDNDGDLLVDYPADSGCDTAADVDERNVVTLVVPGSGAPVTVLLPPPFQQTKIASLLRSCDLNADLRCDLGDLSSLLFRMPESGPVDPRFDLSGDGRLNLADIGLLIHYSVWVPPPVTPPPGPALLYLVSTKSRVAPGDIISIGVNVATAISVNAVEVELGYHPGSLAFVGARTGQSLIEVWPQELQALHEGLIRLRGGLSKPFVGESGFLAELIFRVLPDAAIAPQWSLRRGTLYRADGLGSPLSSRLGSLSVVLQRDRSIPQEDTTRREPESPPLLGGGRVPPLEGGEMVSEQEVSRDILAPEFITLQAFHNPWGGGQLLVWHARDTESGVGISAVRFRKWLLWNNWIIEESPAPIPWGAWSVGVRVADHAGNVREQSLILWEELIFKVITLSALAMLLWFVYVRRSSPL